MLTKEKKVTIISPKQENEELIDRIREILLSYTFGESQTPMRNLIKNLNEKEEIYSFHEMEKDDNCEVPESLKIFFNMKTEDNKRMFVSMGQWRNEKKILILLFPEEQNNKETGFYWFGKNSQKKTNPCIAQKNVR